MLAFAAAGVAGSPPPLATQIFFFITASAWLVALLCRVCGRGNFAVVKKGISKKNGKAFAIKHIDKTQINAEDMDMLQS